MRRPDRLHSDRIRHDAHKLRKFPLSCPRESGETGAPPREAYHPFGRPCIASRPCSEYPSGASCEYSEYPSGALCEYSEYRVGAYHPFGRPTVRRVLRGVLYEPCSGGSPHGCFGYSQGTQGTLRMLTPGAVLRQPEVHSPTMAFEVLWAVGGGLRPSEVLLVLTQSVGGYGRKRYSGYSRSRWGATALRGTPGTHAVGAGPATMTA